MKTYAEKRFFEWHEDELSVSLRAKTGSFGGGSEVLVVEAKTFNQVSQSAVYREDDIAVSTTVCGGSYGGGSETLIVEKQIEHELSDDNGNS